MNRLRPLALLLLLAAATVLIAALLWRGPLRARLETALRAIAERQASAALDAPVTIAALRIGLAPPEVEAIDVAIDRDGAVARVARAHAVLRVRTSLRQRRPVFDVSAAGVTLDLPALLRRLPEREGPSRPTPAFRLRRLVVHDVAVRLADAEPPVEASAHQVTGSVTATGGRLCVAAALDAGEVRRGAGTMPVAHAAARLAETAAGWHLRQLALAADGLALDGAPREDALAIDGSLDLARFAALEPALETLRGTIAVSGRLAGALDTPQFDLSLQTPALAYGARTVGALHAAARLERDHVVLEQLALRGLGGEANASGTLQFEPALPYEARVAWRGLDLRHVAATADLPTAALDGDAELRGALAPLRLEVTGAGHLRPAVGPALDWNGRGRLADGGGGGSLEVLQGRVNRVAGEVAVDARQALGGWVALRVGDVDALRGLLPIASLPQVRGTLEASARLDGTATAPRVRGEAHGADLQLAGVTVRRLDGRFEADRHALRSDGVALAIGGGTATLRGTVALDATTANAWSLDAAGIDGAVVAALGRAGGAALPIAGGTLSIDARASGPWPRVRLQGITQLDDFWIGAERVARLRAEVEAADGAWTLEAAARKPTGDRIDVRGRGRGTADVTLEADCPGWTLTAWQQGERALMGGTVRAQAALRGPLAALSGTATASAEDLVLSGRPIGSARLEATATRGRWDAALTLLDDSVRLQAVLHPEAGQPFTVEGTWRDADFTRLVSEAPGLHIDSSGRLRARGRLAALAALEARAEIEALRIEGGPGVIAADTPVAIVCQRGRCTLDALVLRGGDTTLRVTGEAGFDGRLRVALDGAGTLRLLELAGEPIQSARGAFTVDARARREGGGNWRVDGQLGLTRVALDVGLPVAVTRTSGRIVLDGETLRIEQLGGRIGTGTFTVGGTIDLRAGPALTWALEDVGMDPLPNLELEVAGSGTVSGPWQRPRVAGDLRIIRLLYDREIELTDFLPSFNRALADAPRQADGPVVELALHVIAPGELYVENNLARLQARADLQVAGTTARPVLDGRVEMLDGEIYFRGRTFELLGGTVDFRPALGLVAALNISAESLIDTPEASYAVGVRVTGTTADPRVALTADDPSLSQTDIATLITLGRTTAQLRAGGGGGFSVYDALGIVPRQVSGALTGQAERLLPVDRIEFEPTFSPTSGAFEPQLTIGKDLTDNLSASLGQTFGVLSRTRVEVEYRLGPRVSLPVSWESETEQEAGALAGGIRLRYEFWRVSRYTLLSGFR